MSQISVIVPVYKVELYLRRCVDSILGQTFWDFELILVDDGSPDNCGAICDEYARQDCRIHVIHQQNGGLSAARNAGIDWSLSNSESQWIAFVDSDDWIHRDFLHRLFDMASENGCLISACDYYRTNGQEQKLEGKIEVRVLSSDAYYCGLDFCKGAAAVAWNKLYHISLFESLRYPQGRLHEDEFTTYRAVYTAQKIAVTSAPMYAYYQNPQGIMLSKWKPQRLDALDAFEQQIEFAWKGKYDGLLRKAVNLLAFTAHEQLDEIEVLPVTENRQYTRKLRKKMRKALKWGRKCGVFRFSGKTRWLYEEAYRIEPIWRMMRALWKWLRRDK